MPDNNQPIDGFQIDRTPLTPEMVENVWPQIAMVIAPIFTIGALLFFESAMMEAKDAEIDRKDAEIKQLRGALKGISDGLGAFTVGGCHCPKIAWAALSGEDTTVDLDHLPENNYA